MHYQMVCRRHFLQPAQYAPQERGQLPAIRTRPRLFEQMIVTPAHQPDFIWHARRIRAQRVVVSLHVDDPLSLLLFLTHRVAENAAFFILEPFVRGTELVLNPSRHENRGRQLRMCMRPFFSRQRALVLKNAYILKPRVLLQIGDTGRPHPQHPFDLFIAELRHSFVVLWCLHDDLVGPERHHFVVHPFGHTSGFPFNVIERLRVW